MAGISRVTRSKEEAQAAYDRLSRWYDLLANWGEARLRDLGLEMLDAQDGENILETGFGTGHGLVALARSVGRSGQVAGIDLSPGMVRMARARLAAAGLDGRASLRQGDAVAQG